MADQTTWSRAGGRLAIPPDLQRFMAERANVTVVEVPASHISFVSQPEAATKSSSSRRGHDSCHEQRLRSREGQRAGVSAPGSQVAQVPRWAMSC